MVERCKCGAEAAIKSTIAGINPTYWCEGCYKQAMSELDNFAASIVSAAKS